MVSTEALEYLDAVPADRKPLVERLHGLILDLFPEADVDLSYRMPTYRFGDGWVALANQKRYVSLYTCGAHHLVEFKKAYPGIKTGKGRWDLLFDFPAFPNKFYVVAGSFSGIRPLYQGGIMRCCARL